MLTKWFHKLISVNNMEAPVVTENQLMVLGLTIANYHRWDKCHLAANIDRFKSQYGITPATAAALWRDLRVSENVDCRLIKRSKPKHLLLALRFLFTYQTEPQLGSFFGMHSNKTVANHCKVWVRELQLLLKPKVSRRLVNS